MKLSEAKQYCKTLPSPFEDMGDWINIDDEQPKDDQDVIYYFDVFDASYVGKYELAEQDPEALGTDENGNPWVFGVFYSNRGFLGGGEVQYWQPVEIDDET